MSIIENKTRELLTHLLLKQYELSQNIDMALSANINMENWDIDLLSAVYDFAIDLPIDTEEISPELRITLVDQFYEMIPNGTITEAEEYLEYISHESEAFYGQAQRLKRPLHSTVSAAV